MTGRVSTAPGAVVKLGNVELVPVILSLCDYTGEWPKPYREAGYEVVSFDTQRDGTDVRLMHKPGYRVHGIMAAPPCTVFANSGARWARSDDDMREGLSVVDACLRLVTVCKPTWWVLENPVGKLSRYLGPPQMYFDPCDYGDPYTKRTGLWGSFTHPPKVRVEPTEGSKMWSRYGGRSVATKNARSVTPAGFARAFFEANP